MVQTASGAGLLQEALKGHLVGLGGNGQFLDRDRSIKESVVGQVDGAKGASAQDALNAVLEQLLVGGKGHLASSAYQVRLFVFQGSDVVKSAR